MIARLHVVLPFHLAVPEGKEFTLYSYDDNGYEVTVYPPVKTDHPIQSEIPDSVLIDEAPAFVANGLRIDFRKERCDRTAGIDSDPPMALIQRSADSFVTRIRYVTTHSSIALALRQLEVELSQR